MFLKLLEREEGSVPYDSLGVRGRKNSSSRQYQYKGQRQEMIEIGTMYKV